jgi:hypothetical protein
VTLTPPPSRPVLALATAVARTWPLTVTHDLGERATPSGDKITGWQTHIRCAHPGCDQSVFCAGNDSGAYTWMLGRDLEPRITAHLYQCHRTEMGLPEPKPDA